MAIVNSYPIGTPKTNDLLVGTSMPDVNTDADPITKNFPISNISTLIAAEIPQGPAGAAGADGADGANGANGTNGTNGTNGADGADGAPGANGADGADGQDGAQGPAGADGTSINILGTKPTVGDLPTTGNTVGDLWVIDQSGGGATAGDGYVWTDGGAWLNIGPLRGPQGIQGIAGVNGTNGTNGTDGATGATGPAGADGVDGIDGTNGTDGAPGATGPQGPQGIQGPTGPSGGVTSVTAGLNITVTPTVGDVEVSAPGAIVNTTDVYTGTPKVAKVISLTQAEYDAATIDANTLYVII